MVAANIFPGDMLFKNFGMTRQGRVVFYDYDEVRYLTECNFRRIPEPRTPEDEMAAEPWYPVGPGTSFRRSSPPSCWATRGYAVPSCATTPTCSRPISGRSARPVSG